MQHPAKTAGLYDWSEISEMGWEVLLLGNGMSINISPRFDYGSLFEEANFKGGLKQPERRIFEAFATRNFEVVLSKLRDAITMAEVLKLDPAPYKRRFRNVQSALGRTVRKVHLGPGEVPPTTLATLQDSFLEHRAIFSTSYDLIAYWAMSHNSGFRRFVDCLWANERCEFDPQRPGDRGSRTPIYYPHGALHLVVGGSGVTRKLTRRDLRADEKHLLERFDKPIPGDPEARPLLITEGSSPDKLREIEGNAYLTYVYERLKAHRWPLVVFGHSLGEQDQHLLDAINANPDRPVAISMRKRDRATISEERHRILSKLKTNQRRVYFFDAATHPLGLPEHCLTPAARRKRKVVPRKKRTPRRA